MTRNKNVVNLYNRFDIEMANQFFSLLLQSFEHAYKWQQSTIKLAISSNILFVKEPIKRLRSLEISLHWLIQNGDNSCPVSYYKRFRFYFILFFWRLILFRWNTQWTYSVAVTSFLRRLLTLAFRKRKKKQRCKRRCDRTVASLCLSWRTEHVFTIWL